MQHFACFFLSLDPQVSAQGAAASPDDEVELWMLGFLQPLACNLCGQTTYEGGQLVQ